MAAFRRARVFRRKCTALSTFRHNTHACDRCCRLELQRKDGGRAGLAMGRAPKSVDDEEPGTRVTGAGADGKNCAKAGESMTPSNRKSEPKKRVRREYMGEGPRGTSSSRGVGRLLKASQPPGPEQASIVRVKRDTPSVAGARVLTADRGQRLDYRPETKSGNAFVSPILRHRRAELWRFAGVTSITFPRSQPFESPQFSLFS